MSYEARVFRVLIASPGDVTEEREIAVRTIQEWNDLNSGERQIVLLPLRWETHSAPEYGKRPQEVINRQVVDHCDLLLGIFWTRVGTPTGKADSGTIEEIERVAEQGRPIMLYFSTARQHPDDIDLDQLKRLRDFKQKTFKNALVETYSSSIDFRDKLSKQLEIQIRGLLAAQNLPEELGLAAKATTDIRLEFASPQTGEAKGQLQTLSFGVIAVPDFKSLPDYEEKPVKVADKGLPRISSLLGDVNRDYYRESVAYAMRQEMYQPLRFWLKNEGTIGARDIHVDISATSEGGRFHLAQLSEVQSDRPSKSVSGGYFIAVTSKIVEPSPEFSDSWQTHIELPALQPKREISPAPELAIAAEASATITLIARIYADTLPQPITQKLTLQMEVQRTEVKAEVFLKALQERDTEAA